MISTDGWAPGQPGTRRLVLWRHGRTDWNAVGRAQGHADVSLDDVGRSQAASAAPHLASYRPSLLWSSDLARARETAETLAALLPGLGLRLDPRLREYAIGVRTGLTFAEFAERFPREYAEFAAGDGGLVAGAESTASVRERVAAAISDAADALEPGETGVLVGHGASLRTGLLAFLGVPEEHGEIISGMSNCAWAVVELRGHRGWQIVDYNARTLPDPSDLTDDPHPLLDADAGAPRFPPGQAAR